MTDRGNIPICVLVLMFTTEGDEDWNNSTVRLSSGVKSSNNSCKKQKRAGGPYNELIFISHYMMEKQLANS